MSKQHMYEDKNIPSLDSLSKKTPFSVPDGYFDSLPYIIQSKAIKPRFSLPTYYKWTIGISTLAAALVIGFIWTSPSISSTSNKEDALAILNRSSQAEINAYLSYNDIESDELEVYDEAQRLQIEIKPTNISQQNIHQDLPILNDLNTEELETLEMELLSDESIDI